MKHIRKFNESKKEKKVEDQEVLFNAEVLADKDEKPSFTTEVEDNEKVQKEFKKSMDKIVKFESFITVNIDNVENMECENEWQDSEEETEEETQSCGCGGNCQCEEIEDYCDSCDRVSSQCVCGDESNPETDVKVMNMADFMNSLGQ
jgi:hypothetical protein